MAVHRKYQGDIILSFAFVGFLNKSWSKVRSLSQNKVLSCSLLCLRSLQKDQNKLSKDYVITDTYIHTAAAKLCTHLHGLLTHSGTRFLYMFLSHNILHTARLRSTLHRLLQQRGNPSQGKRLSTVSCETREGHHTSLNKNVNTSVCVCSQLYMCVYHVWGGHKSINEPIYEEYGIDIQIHASFFLCLL